MAVTTVEARERDVVKTTRKFQSISETVIKILTGAYLRVHGVYSNNTLKTIIH